MIVWDLDGSSRLGRPFVATTGSFPSNSNYPPLANLVSVSPTGGLFAAPECGGRVLIRDVTTLHKISPIKPCAPLHAPVTMSHLIPIDCDRPTTPRSHRTGSVWSSVVRGGR